MPNLVGTGLNQVPTNSMLGGLAYQDPEHASIKNLDLKNLSQINSEIADTAVDVFVYDTSKDSDGGAWRKRTQNTSWYNETLGTATRGTRKEFPAVAVIVAESDKVTIYDGDDPDLPMWMVLNADSSDPTKYAIVRSVNHSISSLYALNGIICDPVSFNGLFYQNFVGDACYRVNTTNTIFGGSIVNRNGGMNFALNVTSSGIKHATVNDVAMTVLPNAPIDDTTGLPVPTIAVGTEGGVSVIKDDGTVVDIVGHSIYKICKELSFTDDDKIAYTADSGTGRRSFRVDSIPSSDFVVTSNQLTKGNGEEFYVSADYGLSNGDLAFSKESSAQINDLAKRNVAHNTGLSLIEKEDGGPRHAFVTSSFNTGWMHGDIKGAFLSDTDTTNVTQLINNGDFSNGTSDWTGPSGVSDTNSLTINGSGQAVWTVDSGAYWLSQPVSLIAGETYAVSLDLISVTTNVWLRVGSSSLGSGDLFDQLNFTSGTLYEFTVPSNWTSNSWLQFGVQSGTGNNMVFDNVKFHRAERDRSVNDNGLQVFGTITKSAVATGAELVAYSGWSTSNYLEQPYNSNLNFGTGDYYVMGWAKPTSNTAGYVWEIGQHQNTNGYTEMFYHNSGEFRFYLNGVGNVQGAAPLNIWTHFVCLRQSGVMYMFINGVRQSITVNNTASLNNTSAKLRIGIRAYDIVSPFFGEISLVRTGAGAPSPEQIKKIYEDEKVLFQENAKCTLYGSSDAVTDLAYDATTNLLHVGTSAGRSEFQGLRRINNTTDAVTTAISASNGLVAEQ